MPEEYEQREQQLLSVTKKVFSEIWNDRSAFIKKDYEANQEQYDKDIMAKIESLLTRWENIYGNETEGLKYVLISPLGSGVITKSYEFQIALFDQRLYLDENPLCLYWTPEFIYKDVETDMDTYKKMASKEIIRLRGDEINEMRRRYVLCHSYIAMFYMDKIIRQMKEQPIWQKVFIRDARVLYGTYMEQTVEIGVKREAGGA